MIKGIIFDMDGTLLESMIYWKKSGEEVIKEMVLPKYPTIFNKVVPVNDVIKILQEKIDDKDFLLEVLKNWYLVKMRNYYKTVEFKEGLIPFLEKCKKENIKMYIATATPKEMAYEVVKNLDIEKYFEEVVTIDMGFRNKKHTDIYDYCLNKMNLTKDEVLVFEDTLTPITTLHNANYKIVAVYDVVSSLESEKIRELSTHFILNYNNLDVSKW